MYKNKPINMAEEKEKRKENRERIDQEVKKKVEKSGNQEQKDPKAVI